MKYYVLSALVLVLLVMFFMMPNNVFASKCGVPLSFFTTLTPSQFFLLSNTTFVGTVSSISNHTNYEWKVQFDVEKIWKGGPANKITVITNSLIGCGYTMTEGEKYLIYAHDYPLHTDPIWTRPFPEAQNDIAFLDDPKVQAESKLKQELNKKLTVAKEVLSSMMIKPQVSFPINMVGVDEINSVLEVGFDDKKSQASEEKYRKKLKEIIGDFPIKIVFGKIIPVSNNNDIDSDHAKKDYLHLSPLKQLKSGTPSQYVHCNNGLELLIKASNGQPICVKPSTKVKLLYIKWAEPTRILG